MLAQGTPLHVVSESAGAREHHDHEGRVHLPEGDKRAAAESMSQALFGA